MRVWKAGKIGEAVVVNAAGRGAERAQGASSARLRIARNWIHPGIRVEVRAGVLLEIHPRRCGTFGGIRAMAGGHELCRADERTAAAPDEAALSVIENDQAHIRVRGVLDPIAGNS